MKTGSYDVSTSKLLEALTNNQIATNNNFVVIRNEIENANQTLAKHEAMLAKRVYLSPKEALDVQNAVTQKVKRICYEKNLEYQFVRKHLFKRIYTTLDEYFGVATYRELPSVKMNEILEFINNIRIFTDDLIQASWQLDFGNDY